ncbi:MAG: heme-copper oxidase subunit III [Planctomycetota bacterium]
MDTAVAHASPAAAEGSKHKLSAGKLGIWLFLGTEIMFFMGLVAVYINERFGAEAWPSNYIQGFDPQEDPYVLNNKHFGAANTFVLILSSVLVVLAHNAVLRGELKRMRVLLVLVLLLGCVFMGIKGVEYEHKIHFGIYPGGEGAERMGAIVAEEKGLDPAKVNDGNMFASTYFLVTGCHALHVIGGIIWLLAIVLLSFRSSFGKQSHYMVEYFGLYWHFVDVVWIFLFPLIYIMQAV